jgi:hypothetical protein
MMGGGMQQRSMAYYQTHPMAAPAPAMMTPGIMAPAASINPMLA